MWPEKIEDSNKKPQMEKAGASLMAQKGKKLAITCLLI